ncbi:MAG: hypothetical protein M3328_15880 [Chloroflexota bacterium]|nr:hypothetical protein [Chloroflexota bacterium]
MNAKTVVSGLGAFLAATLVTVGTIVGSASAQSSTATATTGQAAQPTAQATAQATPGATDTPREGVPGGPGRGGHGGRGGRGGDFLGGDFGGRDGGALTADGASRIISSTNTLLDLAQDDLAYANGKMDTANVTKWLNSAQTLLNNAQTAANASKFGAAGQYAEAARELIGIAEGQMAQTLGADTLPSASQRPVGRHEHFPGGPDAPNATVTQAQASRILSQTYNNLVAQKSLITDSTAQGYLADAQAAYQSAYTSYGAGNYSEAVVFSGLAQRLAGVARHVQAAPSAPDNADTVVPVPAPNF